jgi:hypothetical protein
MIIQSIPILLRTLRAYEALKERSIIDMDNLERCWNENIEIDKDFLREEIIECEKMIDIIKGIIKASDNG